MEITIDDLWKGLEGQLMDLSIIMDKYDPIMAKKMESVLHHYQYNSGDKRIISIFTPINNINDMLLGTDYYKNIDAPEELRTKLDKFKTDLGMFMTVFSSKYYKVEQSILAKQFEQTEKESTASQLNVQKERNNHIYDEVDVTILDKAILKDRQKRKEVTDKIFGKAAKVKENIDKVAKEVEKIEEKISKKAKKNEEVK